MTLSQRSQAQRCSHHRQRMRTQPPQPLDHGTCGDTHRHTHTHTHTAHAQAHANRRTQKRALYCTLVSPLMHVVCVCVSMCVCVYVCDMCVCVCSGGVDVRGNQVQALKAALQKTLGLMRQINTSLGETHTHIHTHTHTYTHTHTRCCFCCRGLLSRTISSSPCSAYGEG